MNKYLSFQNVLKVIALLLLFYASSRHQYGYYIFLRWYVFITGIYFAYESKDASNKTWFISFVVISLLFNPFIPIYMKKDIWTFIDVLSGIMIFISIFFLEKNKN